MFQWLFNKKIWLSAFIVINLELSSVQVSVDNANGETTNINLGNQVSYQFRGSSGTSVTSEKKEQTIQMKTTTPVPLASPSIAPKEEPKKVDTLDYFLTDYPDKGLDGERSNDDTDFVNGHPLSQTIFEDSAKIVKWEETVFETYKWDKDYIYLVEDHSVSGSKPAYGFSPGIWMKRNMDIGEKIRVDNNIKWFNADCTVNETRNFPIEMTLEKQDKNYDIGGDLGVQDVIVLKYDSSVDLSDGLYERYYFSKQWGWIRWEEYDKKTGDLRNRRTFNKIVQPIAPNSNLSCL